MVLVEEVKRVGGGCSFQLAGSRPLRGSRVVRRVHAGGDEIADCRRSGAPFMEILARGDMVHGALISMGFSVGLDLLSFVGLVPSTVCCCGPVCLIGFAPILSDCLIGVAPSAVYCCGPVSLFGFAPILSGCLIGVAPSAVCCRGPVSLFGFAPIWSDCLIGVAPSAIYCRGPVCLIGWAPMHIGSLRMQDCRPLTVRLQIRLTISKQGTFQRRSTVTRHGIRDVTRRPMS